MTAEKPPGSPFGEVHPEETRSLTPHELTELDKALGKVKAEMYPLVKRKEGAVVPHATRVNEERVETGVVGRSDAENRERVMNNLERHREAGNRVPDIYAQRVQEQWIPPQGGRGGGGAGGEGHAAHRSWFSGKTKRNILWAVGIGAAGAVGVPAASWGLGALFGAGAASTATASTGIGLGWLAAIGGPIIGIAALMLLEFGVMNTFWNLVKKVMPSGGGHH